MTNNLFKLSSTKTIVAIVATLSLLLGFAFFAPNINAHQDPLGCDSNGVGLSLTVLRADGTTTVVSSGGTIQSGETVKYRATLSHLGGTNCNFEGGTLTITTPDGVAHIVASPATPVVPLVTLGFPFVAPLQTYVAAEANSIGDGDFDASAAYTNGIAHLDADEQSAGANTNIETPFVDTSLQVTKTAVEANRTTYTWTIDKSVTPSTWDLFRGDSGTSEYTIVLDKSVGISSPSVSGTITIHNPAAFASANITSVTDSITGVGAVTVVCPEALPKLLGPGADFVCSYSSALPDTSTRTNTATVVTSGDVNGGSDDETIDFTGVVPTEVGGTVNVDDTFDAGDKSSVTDDITYKYSRTFTCDADEGTKDNIATIVETGQSDSASVQVNCHALEVTKNANESFDRKYNWSINKVGDQTDLTLAPGQVFAVNYDVTVNMTGSVDSNWAVTGTITVHNPAPISAVINSVSDIVSNNGAATVDCGATVFPYTLLAGQNLVCTYSLSLPDSDSETNTATATLQNYDYPPVGDGVPNGTTDFSGSAAVNFTGATMSKTDECINVSDTFPELALAYADVTVCAGEDTLPKTFEYAHNVGPYTVEQCGIPQVVDNTASFATNNTQATGSDGHRVNITLVCSCTLTQGYWKTHNGLFKGGAPVDDGWENIGVLKEQTLFFNSGKTWFEIFWTAPKGNPYYQLAHQYMAAKLNILNGASTTAAVDAAIAGAEALFNAQGAGDTTLTKPESSSAKGYAETLGSYNEGLIGPGHCSEQNPI